MTYEHRTILDRPQVRYSLERPSREDQRNSRVLCFSILLFILFVLFFVLPLFPVTAFVHLHVPMIRRGVPDYGIIWPHRERAITCLLPL